VFSTLIPGNEVVAFRSAVRSLFWAWRGTQYPRSWTATVGYRPVACTVLRHVVPMRRVDSSGECLFWVTGALQAASQDATAMSALTEAEQADVLARIAAATERDDGATDWDRYDEEIDMQLVITGVSFTVPKQNCHVVVRGCAEPVTITLPAVPTGYQRVLVTHDASDGHAVTVDGNGFTIAGSASARLEMRGISIELAFDGTKWLLV
jgi:hypothetical protein